MGPVATEVVAMVATAASAVAVERVAMVILITVALLQALVLAATVDWVDLAAVAVAVGAVDCMLRPTIQATRTGTTHAMPTMQRAVLKGKITSATFVDNTAADAASETQIGVGANLDNNAVFGTTISVSEPPVLNRIEGTNSRDMLTGTEGDDEILGLGGNDVLSGDRGNDIGQDKIEVTGLSFGALSFKRNSISITDTSEVIATLTGIDTTTLSAADFV